MTVGGVFDKARLCEGIRRFCDVKVAVVGDVILDVFLWGTVSRISPEAPVPIVEVKRESRQLGGAANVAHNIAALGGEVVLFGRVGNDPEGDDLIRLLREHRITTEGIVRSACCPTTVKTRVIAQHQQVVRFDREERRPLDVEDALAMERGLTALPDVHVCIVSDYAKGVVTPSTMSVAKAWAATSGRPLVVDPKVPHRTLYHGVTVLTPNHTEAFQMAGVNVETGEGELVAVGKRLISELGCTYLLITRGPEGMSLFERDGDVVHIPTFARKVFDVTGAGDTVVAVFAMAMAVGLSVREAAYLANLAAGYVVGEVGTATVRPEQLSTLVGEKE